MSEKQDALAILLNISDKIPFFHGLNKEEISGLISDVKVLTYKDKDVLFREGETGRDYMFYLLRGKLAISKISLETKTKIRLAVIDEPSLFGEMMRLTGEARSATVESIDDKTLVLAFKVKEFKETTPMSKFYKNVIQELSNKINKMNKKVH